MFEAIPEAVKLLPQWVCWKYDVVNGKKTKIPINPHNPKCLKAKTNDHTTWGSFSLACTAYSTNAHWLAGIGFVFVQSEPSASYCGIDLDHCRNPETGDIADWAIQHLVQFNSYSDISPSGTGVKILTQGYVPKGKKNGDREIYSHGRFFTLTGNHLPSYGTDIMPCQSEIDLFYGRWFPAREPLEGTLTTPDPSTCGNGLPDDKVIELATLRSPKFTPLFAGSTVDYKGGSEADLALCSILAFWTNKDRAAIDRIFRRSGLHDDKWERRADYREMTIGRAVEGCAGGFIPEPVLPLEDIVGPVAPVVDPVAPVVDPVAPVASPEPVASSSWLDEMEAERVERSKDHRKVFTIDDLEGLPEPTFLIDEHLPNNSYCCMYGESGKYKSFIALEMGLCVAYGIDYLSKYPVIQGKVIYLASEGWSGYKKRIKAWRITHDLESTPCKSFGLIPHSYNLSGDDRGEELKKLINLIQSHYGSSPDFLVIDTLAWNFGGGDENNNKDMGQFNNVMNRLRETFGCTILVIHHTGKDTSRGARGHSSLRAAVDCMIEVAGANNGGGCIIRCNKQKDFEPFGDYICNKNVIIVGKDRKGMPLASLTMTLEGRQRTKWHLLSDNEKGLAIGCYKRFKQDPFTTREIVEAKITKSYNSAYNWLKKLIREDFVIKLDDGYRMSDTISQHIRH